MATQLGPYRLLSELGSGGMGKVYLAEADEAAAGVEPGQKIALKVVHPHLLETPGFFKRFLQEAELGKRVRHENVVRTFDVDAILYEGQHHHYMVVEYVEGKSLRELLVDLRTVPETLLREIALQIAGGLAAIHDAGIVHRDLKPENVLITDDHRVRIMDLGVAKLQEASVRITREGQFAGSFLYAAPEQFKNEEVTPAADLYSLGVMLYELGAGQNPFRGDDASAVIHAHLNVEPAPAADRAPELSPFISEVIGTLLAKEPSGRFETAQALFELLQEGERSPWWGQRERELKKSRTQLPPIQIRRESDVHGRERELRQLRAAWDQAKQGQGSTILIEGEAGIGKTRLVDAFFRTLTHEDAHVLYGSYPPSGGLGGLSDAILTKFGHAGLEQTLAPYMTVTPSLIPAFAALVKHESPPTGSEPLHGDALHAVACHLLHALAAEQPTVWVIDDLHFAPQESRQLVLALARTILPHRAVLLLTSRPGLPEDEITHFNRLHGFCRLPLERLSPREVMELLRDAFKSKALAEKLGGKIAYKSDGVPLFVFELVRGLKESSMLRQLPDGAYEQSEVISDIEVPSAVRDLIGARLKDLSDDDRNLLDAAAVHGFEFDPDLVARASATAPIQALQRLAALERRFGLVRAAGASYRFDHNQLQEVLYEELPEPLRKGYHGLLAQALEERERLADVELADVPGESAYNLAFHYLHSADPRAAVRYLEPALDHLEESHRNEALIELAGQALDAPALLDGGARFAVLLRQGNTLGKLGRREEEETVKQEALALADDGGDPLQRSRVRSALGTQLWMTGRFDDARRVLDEALALAREAGDEQQERRVLNHLGAVLGMRGHAQQALGLFERGGSLNGLGLTQQYLGRYGDAVATLEREIEGGRGAGARSRQGVGLVNLGRLQGMLGRPQEAGETLEQARALLRSLGERRPEAYALHRLGTVSEQVSEFTDAERYYLDALALRREIQYPSGIAETLVALGRLCVARDRHAEAARFLEEGEKLARKIDQADESVLGACYLAALPDGDVAAARAALEHYDERMRVADKMEASFVLWQCGQKESDLSQAHRLLESLIEGAPEDCRTSMIENVPLHRDITKAWEEHGQVVG